MKFNDMPQSFLCDNHLENKFVNRAICYVYFNNAQKFFDSQVRKEVVLRFDDRGLRLELGLGLDLALIRFLAWT